MKLYTIILLGYLSLTNAYAEVKFNLPESSGAYVGQLWKTANKVDLNPPLSAFAEHPYSQTGKICGFHTISETESKLPFDVDLVDANKGIGEIRVRTDSEATVAKQNQYVFQIEAYDCDNPRHTSKRVFVQIAIRGEEELSFTQSQYEFTTGTYISVGSVVGKVTVVHESTNQLSYPPFQCGYIMETSDLVPFLIDSLGVLRTRQVLNVNSPRAFTFQVLYRDCNGYQPKSATTTVNVKVIQNYCEASWQGVPHMVTHSSPPDQVERLLWPPNFNLNTCGAKCPAGVAPRIEAELRLRLAESEDLPLLLANSSFCRHDPRSLQKQRKLCDLHSATVLNLLPNPTRDLLKQVNSPSVGTLPQTMPLSMALLFNASKGSGWRVDNQILMRAAQAHQRQTVRELYPQPELIISKIFEQDFTLSFWLQRQVMQSEEHETILCSQEDTMTMGRALWIGFKGCTIIVQMITRNPQSNQENQLAFRMYSFPELSSYICPRKHLIDEQWHHYSISIVLDQATAELTSSVLMVDGQIVGSLRQLKEPPVFNRPFSQYYSQFITVGTAYDPIRETGQQSLNGALAGLTLLLGQNEDQGNLRCLAECGETLLLPRASSYIGRDTALLLNSDSITMTSSNISEIINILANIAYVKPDEMSTALQFDVTQESSKRALELHTSYMCGVEALVNITMARIELDVQPSVRVEQQESMLGYPNVETVPLADTSAWVPKAAMEDERPRLSIIGQPFIRTEVPTLGPGIPIFPELSFTFTNTKLNARAALRAASVSTLDQCLVIPLNGGSLNVSLGERVNFPIGRIHELGITVDPSSRGILLKGHHTAGQYASLLHGFRYLPPIEVDKRYNDPALSSDIIWIQQFELICSSGKVPINTDAFIVKIMLTSPIGNADFSGIQGNFDSGYNNGDSRDEIDTDSDDDYTYDDEDEDYTYDNAGVYESSSNGNKDIGQWPPINDHNGIGADFAKSDKDIRPEESLNLSQKDDKNEPHFNIVGLSVTLAICGLTVILLVTAFVARNTNVFHRYRSKFFGPSERSNGATSGRLELRGDSGLNVIENPIDRLEGGSNGSWQSGKQLGLRLPGVHGTLGGTKGPDGVLNLQSAADARFDAETRSFDGLFEDEVEDVAAFPGGSATLEDVDDFDESEVIMAADANDIHRGGEQQDGDDEDPSDDGEETFSVGPSHLEFVTLPKDNRQNRDSHHLANV